MVNTGLPTLQDERDTYTRLGWTWPVSAEPHLDTGYPPPNTSMPYVVTNPNIHDTTEADDLLTYIMLWRRTHRQGYFLRAQAWARYFRDDYQQCVGTKYNTYCYDKDGFSLDHAYGVGLIAWWKETGDGSYLDAAVRVAVDLETEYAKPKYVPGYTMAFYGMRQSARALWIITTLADATHDVRWVTLRDKLIALWLTSKDWDAAYGIYWLSQYTTDAYFQTGAYASGVRQVSAFQVAILTEAFWQAYLATGNPTLRARLVAMGQFVARYGEDPVYHYTGYTYGANITTGALVEYNTWLSLATNPVTWNPAYTVEQVGSLVHAYQLSGDASLLTTAQRLYGCGMRGVYNTAQPCNLGATTVPAFLDTVMDSQPLDGMPPYTYMGGDKGSFWSAYPLFLNGGLPPRVP